MAGGRGPGEGNTLPILKMVLLSELVFNDKEYHIVQKF